MPRVLAAAASTLGKDPKLEHQSLRKLRFVVKGVDTLSEPLPSAGGAVSSCDKGAAGTGTRRGGRISFGLTQAFADLPITDPLLARHPRVHTFIIYNLAFIIFPLRLPSSRKAGMKKGSHGIVSPQT